MPIFKILYINIFQKTEQTQKIKIQEEKIRFRIQGPIIDKFDAALCGKLSCIVSTGNVNKDNINDKNELGRTMLYCAARNGHLNVVQWLIEHGADINCLESDGNTPLHGASFYGHKQVVQYLTTQILCDKSIKNADKLTAAEESKDENIKNLITKPYLDSTKRFLIDKSNLPAFGIDVERMAVPTWTREGNWRTARDIENRQEEWKDLLRIYHLVFVKKWRSGTVFQRLQWLHGWQNKTQRNYTDEYGEELLKRLKNDTQLNEKIRKYYERYYVLLMNEEMENKIIEDIYLKKTNGEMLDARKMKTKIVEDIYYIKYSIFNKNIKENKENENNLIANKKKSNDYKREQAIFECNLMYDPLFYYLTIRDVENYLPKRAIKLTKIFDLIVNNIISKKFDENAKVFEQFYFEIVKIFTMQSPLYNQLHSDIGTSNLKISKLKHFCIALDVALHRYCNAWEDICYISRKLTKDQINLFDIESQYNQKEIEKIEEKNSHEDEIHPVFHLPHFLSATKNAHLPLSWGGNAILIVVPDLRRNTHSGAYDISFLSEYPAEEEVLIPWRNQYSCYKVIDIDKCDKCKAPLQMDTKDSIEVKKLYVKYAKEIVEVFNQIKSHPEKTIARVLIIVQKGWFNYRELKKIDEQRRKKFL